MPIYFLMLPFFLQGAAMFVDEFYFHYKRGLPQWEIWGHPLDTLCYLACFALLRYQQPSVEALRLYIGLSLLSCLLITKDEIIHSKLCGIGEMWLHAVLFILHPLTLIAAGVLWWQQTTLIQESATIEIVLSLQCKFIAGFLCYQILYWSVPWKKIARSTMAFITG